MLNFLAYGREFRLNDGQIYTAKRLAIGNYYLLIASVFIYKTALEKTSGIKSKKKTLDYIKFMRENSIEFAKVKVEWDNIVKYLGNWVEGIKVEKLEHRELVEVLGSVIEFNTVKSTGTGRPLKALD